MVYGRTLRPIGTRLGDHPSRPHVTMGLVQPTRGSKGTSNPPLASELHPCLALLPMAVAWPPTLLPAPVVSYTTFSPLPKAHSSGGRFLWSCARVSPPGSYPASCSLERGLSSCCRCNPRSPGRPTNQSYHNAPTLRRQFPQWYCSIQPMYAIPCTLTLY